MARAIKAARRIGKSFDPKSVVRIGERRKDPLSVIRKGERRRKGLFTKEQIDEAREGAKIPKGKTKEAIERVKRNRRRRGLFRRRKKNLPQKSKELLRS